MIVNISQWSTSILHVNNMYTDKKRKEKWIYFFKELLTTLLKLKLDIGDAKYL